MNTPQNEPTPGAVEELARVVYGPHHAFSRIRDHAEDIARAVLAAGYVKREDTDEGWTTLVDEHGKMLAFLDDLKRESERGRGGDIAGMVDRYLGRPDATVQRVDKYSITIGESRPLAANADQEMRIRAMTAEQRDKLARLLGKRR